MTMAATNIHHGMIESSVPRVSVTQNPTVVELCKFVTSFLGDEKAARLNEALPAGDGKLELVDILNIMARLGYSGTPLELRLRDIDSRLLPCLFVSKRKGNVQAVIDPSRARTRGVAYIFKEISNPDRQQQREAQAERGWFRQLLMRFQPLLWRVGIIGLAHSLVAVGIPLFLMIIYDRLTGPTSTTTIYTLGTGAFIVVLILTVLRLMQTRTLSWMSGRIDYIAGTAIFTQLVHRPAHALERVSVASQISRLKVFEPVAGFFASPLFMTLVDLPFSLLALIAIFMIAGPLGFVPLTVISVLAILAALFVPRLRLAMQHATNAREAVNAYHMDYFERLSLLRVSGLSDTCNRQFREISAQGALMDFRSRFLGHLLEAVARGMILLGAVAVIYVGVELVWNGSITGGALFASFLLALRVMMPWRTLCGALPYLEQLRQGVEQINHLMSPDTGRMAAKTLSKPGHVQGTIAFSKIGFRYKNDSEPVFSGLSFGLKSGQMLAIMGGNGTGKSTILKLAMGLYRPQAGTIAVDGRDIRQIDPAALRREFAYVPQIPELFEGTLAENVRLGNPNATDQEILRALDITDLEKAAACLPKGLETPIRAGGDGLPASLAYRIALARAYVRDTAVLLCDELPPAVLNSDAGQRFIERLRAWRGGKTILLVTHRADLARMADRAIGFVCRGHVIVDSPEQVIQKLRDACLTAHDNKLRDACLIAHDNKLRDACLIADDNKLRDESLAPNGRFS